MQLSLRLTAIADMVTEGNRLADVGCDHGYLPVYLLQKKIIPGAIAMDVRSGPLSRAKEHIWEYHMENYIETRLSDGLEALKPGEADTLVLAGMGGPLMERILSRGKEVRESFSEMILQPQSDVPHFRRYVREEGWEIIEEDMILEDGKFYPMMKAVHGQPGQMELYTKEEERFGKHLLLRRHPVLKEYLQRELRIREQIAARLKDAPTDGARARLLEVEEEKGLIISALGQYESI